MGVYSTKFTVTILGSNSALPANGRHPTAQLLNVNNHYYLIDCGEGTQMQLRRYNLKMQRIKAIFISHMHGDHYFGLVGLLNSLHLLGRKAPLSIYAPPQLKAILDLQLDASGGRMQYPIHFHAIEPFEAGSISIHEDSQVKVEGVNLKHRIKCYGFRFTETEKEFSYLPEKGGPARIKVEEIPVLKQGSDVVRTDGTTFDHRLYTVPPPPQRSYAYCTDTLPLDSTVEFVKGADLLYHESTFLEKEQQRSKETYHSTAKEAADVAKRAGVKRLMLGHYSARYTELDEHLSEAKSIFSDVILSKEGLEVEIN